MSNEKVEQPVIVADITRSHADRIKPLLEVKGDVIVAPNDLVTQLAAGVEGAPTAEEITKVHKWRDEIVPGLELAAGEMAIDHMAANKEIVQMQCRASYGDDEIKVLVQRNHSHAAEPGKKDSAVVTTHGRALVGYDVKTNNQINTVRRALKQYAATRILD